MKIYIDQIPEPGLDLTESCEPSALDLNRVDIKFAKPIELSAQITKGIDNISVKLSIDAAMHLNCSRCLEELTTLLSKEINLNFPIEGKKEIDLTDNLREEIILSYPLKPLCRLDCLGLCVTCGQNLNKGKCGCIRKQKTENRKQNLL